MTDVDELVANYLDTAITGLTKGTNLFKGKVQAAGGAIPARAVFVLANGGPAPETYSGSPESRRYSALQVRTRVEQQAFGVGQSLARDIRDALDQANISGMIDTRVNETEPLYIGEDDDGMHEWSTNIELWYEE
jgi:hypothetical protein